MNRRRIGAWCGIFAGISFIIITFGIMLIYPGGYSFLENTFSSLGFSVTDGYDTPLNWFLFATATTLSGITGIPFWLTIRTEFTETISLKVISGIATALGIIAGICLCGVGIFAADVYPYYHGWSTILFFILEGIAIAVISVGILLNAEYENVFSVVGFIVCALALLYIYVIHGAAMQKVAVYAIILFTVIQGYKLLKVFDNST